MKKASDARKPATTVDDSPQGSHSRKSRILVVRVPASLSWAGDRSH